MRLGGRCRVCAPLSAACAWASATHRFVPCSVGAGKLHYVLPGRTEYAIGSTTIAQVPAFSGLRGDVWSSVLAAVPQVVPGGTDAGDAVRVEFEYEHVVTARHTDLGE